MFNGAFLLFDTMATQFGSVRVLRASRLGEIKFTLLIFYVLLNRGSLLKQWED